MRGSRPGERRGGRQKGTPNKKTAYVRAVMAAHSTSPKLTPMDVMLAVMRDPHVALDMRVKMALRALPRLHGKLGAGESASVAGDQSLPTRRRKNPFPDARCVDEPSTGGSVNDAAAPKSDGARSIKGEASSIARATGALAEVLPEIPVSEGGNGTGIMPLPFLLRVLNDAKAPAAIKVKVASATMPYTHPRQSTRPAKPSVVTDRFGFTVEPALARRLRNEIARLSVLKKRRHPHPRDQKVIQKLNEKIDVKLATLQCPCLSGYSAKQAASDKEKIEYLWRKRRSRRKLTPNEDAVLAHINARYWAFAFGPEARARARLRVLKDKERLHRRANGLPPSPWEKGELKVLTTFYPPEILEVDPDHEAFLERHSIFSEYALDSDVFSVEQRFVPAPERTQAPTSKAAAQSHDPEPEPEPLLDLEEDSPGLPPFCTIDRELSEKRGRTILKWTFET